MRVVLTAAVVAAALRSPAGASAALIRLIDCRLAVLLLTMPLVRDYRVACQEPSLRSAARLTESQVGTFLDGLFGLAKPVMPARRPRSRQGVSCDRHVLDAALHGVASAIVCFNRGEYAEACARHDMTVLTPRDAWARILG